MGILLAQRGYVPTNATEPRCSLLAPETARDLLPYFDHAQVPLRQVVIKGPGEVVHESEHRPTVFVEAIQQVLGLALFGTPTLAGRCWRRIRSKALGKQSSVSSFEGIALLILQPELARISGLIDGSFDLP